MRTILTRAVASAAAFGLIWALPACGAASSTKPAAQDPVAGRPPLHLVATIPLPGVEGRIDHLALDAAHQRLFVAALGNGSVEVVSLATAARVRSIGSLVEPQGIAYLPDLERLVVACGDGRVWSFRREQLEGGDTPLDLASVVSIDLGDDADNVRYDPRTQRALVGFGSGAIAVVDPVEGKLLGKGEVGGHPESFQLEEGGDRVFVNVAGRAEVAVIALQALDAACQRWPLADAAANFPMAYDAAGRRLFLGCRAPASVVVLGTGADDHPRQLERVPCAGDPDDLFLDQRRRVAYVVCGAGVVDVFVRGDGDRLTHQASVETRRGARTGLFDPASDRLFVAVPKDGARAAEVRVYAPTTDSRR